MVWTVERTEARAEQADALAKAALEGNKTAVVGPDGLGKTDLLLDVVRRLGDRALLIRVPSGLDQVEAVVVQTAAALGDEALREVDARLRECVDDIQPALDVLARCMKGRLLVVDDLDYLATNSSEPNLRGVVGQRATALESWLSQHAAVCSGADIFKRPGWAACQITPLIDPPLRLFNGAEYEVHTLWDRVGRDLTRFRLALTLAQIEQSSPDRIAVREDTVLEDIWAALPASFRDAIALLAVHGRPLPNEVLQDSAGRLLAFEEITLVLGGHQVIFNGPTSRLKELSALSGIRLGNAILTRDEDDHVPSSHFMAHLGDAPNVRVPRRGGDLKSLAAVGADERSMWVEGPLRRFCRDSLTPEERLSIHLSLAAAFAGEIRGDEPNAWSKASFLMEAHRHYAAGRQPDRALQLARYGVPLLLDLARERSRQRDYTMAAAIYEEVLKLSEGKVGRRAWAYAKHYLHYNRYKSKPDLVEPLTDTRDGYRSSVESWPENALFWSRLALTQFLQGDRGQGLNSLIEARRSVPEHSASRHTGKEWYLRCRTVQHLLRFNPPQVIDALHVWQSYAATDFREKEVEQELFGALERGFQTTLLEAPHVTTVHLHRPITVKIARAGRMFVCSFVDLTASRTSPRWWCLTSTSITSAASSLS